MLQERTTADEEQAAYLASLIDEDVTESQLPGFIPPKGLKIPRQEAGGAASRHNNPACLDALKRRQHKAAGFLIHHAEGQDVLLDLHKTQSSRRCSVTGCK